MVKNEVALWREYFLRLDDKQFLTLMRLYLGEIKTPYNKQNLIESLEAFLRREETKKNILALLSDADTQVLCAIKFIPGATLSKLQEFFKAELFCEMLEDILRELKARLLIYEQPVAYGLSKSLKINPFLAPALDEALRLEELIPECDGPEKRLGSECVGAEFVASYLSFVAKNPKLCKLDGTFKKKAESDIEEKFPGRLEKARLLTRALENLLILKDKEGVFEVDWKRAKNFAQMDAQSQAMYLLASVSARYSRTKTKFYSQVFLDALKSVPAKGFKRGAFLRCAYLLCCKENGQEDSFVGSQSRFARIIQSHRQEEADLRGNSNGAFFERMMEQAEVFGFALFEDVGESVDGGASNGASANDGDGEKIIYKNPRFFESRVPPKNIAMVNVDSGFSLTLMPGFGLARVLEIAVFSDLVKFDTVVQFEINQSSAIRAFDQGLEAEQIINILKDNSNFAVPEALEFSIKEWEANYKSICVYKGFVLKVSQERSEALLHNPNLKKRVLERLAPQVFLLDCKDEDEVAALLKNCGVENIGKIKGAEDEPELTGFVPLKRSEALFDGDKDGALKNSAAKKTRGERSEKRLQEIYCAIDALELDGEQKDVLRNVASAKMIVNDSQLCAPAIPLEKNSAQGMDYEGKLHVIDQAIKEGEQIIFRLSKKSKLVTGFPIGIDRNSFEDGVYLNVFVGKEQKEISIGKIEFVQRVKKLSIL
ncbi:MAG: helicase-associated domain-containing protein [Treponema sp.]|nr:helicase-associated domain-containing protein [Treponema sp.]